jgi:hypothetical protein
MSGILERRMLDIYGIPPWQEAMKLAAHGAVKEPFAKILL